MTDSARIPRETPAQYAERHRRAANDGRPDRVAELAADIEAHVQRGLWSLTVAQAVALNDLSEHRDDIGHAVAVSGDHRPFPHALHPYPHTL